MNYAPSPYRWAVLAAFAFVNLTIQTLWISYAPIAGLAASFYGVGDVAVGMFAMSFMIAFVPLSLPASWAIDRFGFRVAVGFGSLLMGVLGTLRGLSGASFPLAMLATAGIAAAQPFLLNAWTTVPAKWFPSGERATAVGVVTLGNLIGTAIGMVLPPLLAEAGVGIDRMQLAFGLAALVSAAAFLLLARERPAVPPSEDAAEERALVLDGLRRALSDRRFWLTLAVAFVGLGVFNGLTTWVEAIIRPRGFGPTVAGTLGALMLGGGLGGAVVIPALSDRFRARRRFLVVSLAGTIPGVLGLAWGSSEPFLLLSAAWTGFFLVSALPVAMQYGAEVTRPAPEGTSNGLIQLAGQGAVVFVYAMGVMRDAEGTLTPALIFAACLLALGIAATAGMKDAETL